MNDGTVSVPSEQDERLTALAAARGVTPEAQLARLIDDAYEGLDADAPDVSVPTGEHDEEQVFLAHAGPLALECQRLIVARPNART